MENKENKKRPLEHGYLFESMADAEFADEGIIPPETEEEKNDTLPYEDEIRTEDLNVSARPTL